ncbi:hypothetical protein DFH07DRAFT_954815 [Mycena maculata]|uniref:Uncharacterized protein n=1 Tax=Mycena maculata TaxID=230809 RepID=A0AAD7JMB0_9AGAR|nr:hypothetical protein DFH07DRAFT_954815 [Mycena maculata]
MHERASLAESRHTSLALTWMQRPRAKVPPPISAIAIRIVLPHGSTTEDDTYPRPPLGAPRVCRPPHHLLVANAAHPGSVLPIYSTSITVFPLRRRATRGLSTERLHRKCVGDGKTGRASGGSPRAQLAGRSEEGSPRTARRAMSPRGGENGAGRAEAQSVRRGWVGVGVPQLHRVKTTQKGRRATVSIGSLLSSAHTPD